MDDYQVKRTEKKCRTPRCLFSATSEGAIELVDGSRKTCSAELSEVIAHQNVDFAVIRLTADKFNGHLMMDLKFSPQIPYKPQSLPVNTDPHLVLQSEANTCLTVEANLPYEIDCLVVPLRGVLERCEVSPPESSLISVKPYTDNVPEYGIRLVFCCTRELANSIIEHFEHYWAQNGFHPVKLRFWVEPISVALAL